MNKKKPTLLNKKSFKKWYVNKGLILIDIFIIIGLIQYFIFNGSYQEMINWIKLYLLK